MTSTDFSPLLQSMIGFDRLLDLLDGKHGFRAIDTWPPYNIEKTGEDAYRIAIAVAGFSQDELSVTQEPNLLVVSGRKASQESGEYLHRGIAARGFQRRFELADHVQVTGAALENGMLTIDLVREIPEELRPRRIAVQTATLAKPESRQIGHGKRAA